MTIVFQGHVERIEVGAPGTVNVHVVTPQAECGQTVVLHVPAKHAAHWLPGLAVQFTVYAYDPTGPKASAA